MGSYGSKYPRHKTRPFVVEQSGQCVWTLTHQNLYLLRGNEWNENVESNYEVHFFRPAPESCNPEKMFSRIIDVFQK